MKSRFVFLLVVALIAPLVRGQDKTVQPAAAIPPAIKAFLDARYPGWIPARTPARALEDDKRCWAENPLFSFSVVRGDFNGDGKVDYAVQIAHRQKLILFEFLSHGATYSPHILYSVARADGAGNILAVDKKGEPLVSGGPPSNIDSVSIGAVCGGIGEHFIYNHGKFNTIRDGD